ncbi:MAG: arsenate reductase ArsC [Microlunatus sp.]|nr:arsenate reductase ArsC [Microlunatus sp.]
MTQPTTLGTNRDYNSLVDDLTYRFDGIHDRTTVTAAVEQARVRLEATATIPDFLPVLVARFAREQLTAAAQADGRIATTMPELLFVCVHNAGRSQLAAALAQHLSNGKVHVRSAGSDPTGEINPLVVQVLAERGIALTDAYPKPLTNDVVRAADVIITMGCGDTCPVFPGRRYLDWKIPDPNGADLNTVRDIRDQIQAHITALLRDLNI